MRKVFRLLAVVLDAIVGVIDEKPRKPTMSIYEAREKYDAGLIGMHEFNEVFERNDTF